jgi:LacI family transcriptional regulator
MKSYEPAYIRVEQSLRNAIHQGRWATGTLLPSRQALAAEFGVSVGTVQQAIENLIGSGAVRSEHGRGTYVNALIETPRDTFAAEARSSTGPLRITVVAGTHPAHALSHPDNSSMTIINAIERACGRLGGSVSYCKRQLSGDDWEPFAETVTRIDWSQTDAVVVVGIAKNIETAADFVSVANTVPKPLVCLAAGELPANIPHVFYDNRYGGYQAATHLIDKGHSHLTYLSPYRASWASDRLVGIQQAMSQKGFGEALLEILPSLDSVRSVDEIGFLSFDMAREFAYDYTRRRLASGAPPRAVVAVSDAAAFGYIDAAQERGLKAGSDYSIIGFDNTAEARDFGLTSLQRPWEAMAEESVRLVFAITSGQHAATQVRMQPHLVPRSSTAISKWEMDRTGDKRMRSFA